MGVKVTGQFEPAGEFPIVDAKDVSGNITGSFISASQVTLGDSNFTGNMTASGDFKIQGSISGSVTSTGSFGRLEIAGDSSILGDVTIGGNINIGDSDTDSLTISADLTSNLIPNADSTFNLGSPTKNWKEGYIEELSSTNITASGDISGSGISTGSLAHLHVSNNIGIGTLSPLATVHISASDGLIIPVGNTSQRSGDAVKGEIRFNTEIQTYEGYDGNNWGSLGGMTDVDKDTLITAETSAGADNDELQFFTAGTERLRIFADGHISASGNITASSNLRVDGDLIVSGLSNPNISNFSSSLHSKITSITSSISALKTDSGSFSTRVTNLVSDSGSFSTRVTTEEINVDKLQITSSALINNFDNVQSLGKTDNVDFNNVTTTGNVSGSLTSTGSFGMIKKDGLDIREHFSRNTVEAFELDENGDFIPTERDQYMVDPRWELDENGDLQRRKRELWTFDWDSYFSD